MSIRLLPMLCVMVLVAGCGRWAWEKPSGSVSVPEFTHDNCECLGERAPVKTEVPLSVEIYDCRLKPGRSHEAYNQCMTAKGYQNVWKAWSP